YTWAHHRAADGEQLGAGRLRRAQAGIPAAAIQHYRRHFCQRLNVIDRSWAAPQAGGGREGRLETRKAALALDALHQRGLFAADIRARAAPQLDPAAEAAAEYVFAHAAGGF